MPGWELQLAGTAQHHERASYQISLAWEKSKIQNSKYISTDYVSFPHHSKVEKLYWTHAQLRTSVLSSLFHNISEVDADSPSIITTFSPPLSFCSDYHVQEAIWIIYFYSSLFSYPRFSPNHSMSYSSTSLIPSKFLLLWALMMLMGTIWKLLMYIFYLTFIRPSHFPT